MLIDAAWCLTFLTCLKVNGQSVETASRHADEAMGARSKRCANWVRGPRMVTSK